MFDISERGKTVELLGTCQLLKQWALSAPDPGPQTPGRAAATGTFHAHVTLPCAGPLAPGEAGFPFQSPGTPFRGRQGRRPELQEWKKMSVSSGQFTR